MINQTPMQLSLQRRENQRLAKKHTLAKIEKNLPTILLTGMGITTLFHLGSFLLDVKVYDLQHCMSSYGAEYIPSIYMVMMASMLQTGIFYAWPYYTTLNQLTLAGGKTQKDKINTEIENNKKSSTKFYAIPLIIFCLSYSMIILRHGYLRKFHYCKMIGISNPKCAAAYPGIVPLSAEVLSTMKSSSHHEIFPLDPQQVNNFFQPAITTLRDLYTPCSHYGHAGECYDSIIQFLNQAKDFQKYVNHHNDAFIKKASDFIHSAIMNCFFGASEYMTSAPTFHSHKLFLFSLAISMLVTLNLAAYLIYEFIHSNLIKNAEVQRYQYLKMLTASIPHLTVTQAAPELYKIYFTKSNDSLLNLSELLNLLSAKSYKLVMQENDIAIVENEFFLYNAWRNQSLLNNPLIAKNFQVQHALNVDIKKQLEKIVTEALNLLNEISIFTERTPWKKEFFYSGDAPQYLLTLETTNKERIAEILPTIKIIFTHARIETSASSSKAIISIAHTTKITSDNKKQFFFSIENLRKKLSPSEDTVTISEKITYKKVKKTQKKLPEEDLRAAAVYTPEIKKITSISTNEVFDIIPESTDPMDGEVFSISDLQSSIIYYFIFTQELITKLNDNPIARDALQLNGMLRIVGAKGERGFNFCDSKASDLSLLGSKNEPVTIQYKNPSCKFRLWGQFIENEEKIPFYSMHTLVEKRTETGKTYKRF